MKIQHQRTNESLMIKRVYRWILRLILFPCIMCNILALFIWNKVFSMRSIRITKWCLWTYSVIEGYLVVNVFDWFVNIVSLVCVIIKYNDLYLLLYNIFYICDEQCEKHEKRKNKRRRAKKDFFFLLCSQCGYNQTLGIDFFLLSAICTDGTARCYSRSLTGGQLFVHLLLPLFFLALAVFFLL
jgi:hypothetical protein